MSRGSTASRVLDAHLGRFGSAEVLVSAPGRLDFLNTHQDYKGLPVVGVAVNLRTYVAVSSSHSGVCRVYSVDTSEYDEFTLGGAPRTRFGAYVSAALRALSETGYRVPCFNLTLASDVPIGAGLASSAALLVATVKGLAELAGIGLSVRDVAELAFTAENRILGVPCGRLDQYTSAYGGVVYIRTRPPYSAESLPMPGGVFVTVDSGVKHSTAEVHPQRQREIDEALTLLLSMDIPKQLRVKLGHRFWEPRWEEISYEELRDYLKRLPPRLAARIEYTVRAHRSTVTALRLLKGLPLSGDDVRVLEEAERVTGLHAPRSYGTVSERLRGVGMLMTYQHILLSKLYEVSLPVLDRMVEAAVGAGAYGAKLSGAGLGGSVIALVEPGRAEAVLKAMLDAGGSRGWIVSVDEGVKRHSI